MSTLTHKRNISTHNILRLHPARTLAHHKSTSIAITAEPRRVEEDQQRAEITGLRTGTRQQHAYHDRTRRLHTCSGPARRAPAIYTQHSSVHPYALSPTIQRNPSPQSSTTMISIPEYLNISSPITRVQPSNAVPLPRPLILAYRGCPLESSCRRISGEHSGIRRKLTHGSSSHILNGQASTFLRRKHNLTINTTRNTPSNTHLPGNIHTPHHHLPNAIRQHAANPHPAANCACRSTRTAHCPTLLQANETICQQKS